MEMERMLILVAFYGERMCGAAFVFWCNSHEFFLFKGLCAEHVNFMQINMSNELLPWLWKFLAGYYKLGNIILTLRAMRFLNQQCNFDLLLLLINLLFKLKCTLR